MLVEITAVTSNGHSCSSCHKIASSYFPFLPVHSSVFLWVPLLSSLCPWLFLMVVTVAIFKADTADSSQRLLCQRNSCVCFGREFSHDSTLRMKLRQRNSKPGSIHIYHTYVPKCMNTKSWFLGVRLKWLCSTNEWSGNVVFLNFICRRVHVMGSHQPCTICLRFHTWPISSHYFIITWALSSHYYMNT